MSLILLNLQSNQQIKLNNDSPLIIGRGNVEGCFDKRVSRKHGRVTCTDDGKVRIAALHSNPCFFTRNGIPPVLQLNKNEEETLNEGDFLGLLPNAFWFKVTSNNKNGIKNQPDNSATRTNVTNNEMNETIVLDNSSKSPDVKEIVIIEESDNCASSDKSKRNGLKPIPSTSKRGSNSESTPWGYGNPDFEKTKKFPLYMYEIVDPVTPGSSPKKHSLEDVQEVNLNKKQKVLIETNSDVEIKEEIWNLDAPSTSKVKNDPPVCKSEPQEEATNKGSIEKEGYESDVEESTKRPLCQYEGNCYRKNPQHKLDFTHPGDPDFVPYEERTLCQYGARCYRKDKKHRVEFRHPTSGSDSQNLPSSSTSPSSRASSPLPAKRRRKNVNVQNCDFEDMDESDLEEPFLNDASSDEYLPSDVESEEEDELDESREDQL